MDSKRNSRRELLKLGTALAGGLTVALRGTAQAQEHSHPATPGPENASPMIHGSKEQIEYGQRSKYVTSVRIAHPMGGGEGRRSGGRHPVSPTGKLAKGGKTRNPRKPSRNAIVRRRKSRRYGQLKL